MRANKLWNPTAPENLKDPYPMYRELQETDPVHHSSTGEWVVTRYDDVKSLLKSPSVRVGNRKEWFEKGITYFNNQEEDLRFIQEAIHTFVLFLNPPEHKQIRDFVNRAWTNRDVTPIIHEIIQQLLLHMKGKEVDLIKDFAQPLPILTISRILGIPYADFQYLKNIGTTMVRALDLYHNYKELVQLNQAAKEFITYFSDQIRLKTDCPDDGLISKLIQQNQIEKSLREEELISILIFLFIAGEETTAGSIGTGIFHLLKQPQQYTHLKDHPEMLSPAVEELFRYDSPAQILGRIAEQPIVVNEIMIQAGASIILVPAAANRDPLVFSRPDELNFERANNKHLTFGHGSHFCMGEWLGRVEVMMAIGAIIKTYPNLRLLKQDVTWRKNISIRSLESLMVVSD